MAKYNISAELKPLEKMLNDFTYQHGWDINTVFDDWLFFIINNFNLEPKPVDGWKYNNEQNVYFYNMMAEWLLVARKQVTIHGWYDAFGELYEACVSGKGQRNNYGQFFTPTHICDLMTAVSFGDGPEKSGIGVSDPTCGSGRLLLSFHKRQVGCYMLAEDIDRTCCLMTVANFLIHGVVGEVIWHDSLDPSSWHGGWKVNEHLNKSWTPLRYLPHMRAIEREESHVMRNWEAKLNEIARRKSDKENKK